MLALLLALELLETYAMSSAGTSSALRGFTSSAFSVGADSPGSDGWRAAALRSRQRPPLLRGAPIANISSFVRKVDRRPLFWLGRR